MFTMAPPRTICTYDIYNGLVRPFPLLEDMLKDPKSNPGFKISGLKQGTAYADIKLLAFLEEMLSSPPSSDQSGAERVLTASRANLIGVAAQADHADLPLIMRYCKVHQDVMPLTCLVLICYGHTKEWTLPAVSQHTYPAMKALADKLEPTPMIARAVVEFVAADYDVNEWLPDQITRSLPKLGFANKVLRGAERLSAEPLDDARNQLAGLLKDFIKKSGSLANGLMELSASALNKLPLPDGTLVNGKEIEVAGLVLDLLSDHAGRVWPLANKIAPADLFGLFSEFFDLNQRSREGQFKLSRAFDDRLACTWMLNAIAGDDGSLSERFVITPKIDEGRTASLLSGFMSMVDTHVSDQDLKQVALLKLTASMSNWIGSRNLYQTNIGFDQQNEILRIVFRPEQLSHLDSMLSAYGRRVITSFVMAEHRSLARHLNRDDRGRHLEDEIGL